MSADELSPSERYADVPTAQGPPGPRDFRRSTTSRSTTSSCEPAARSRRGAASWSPRPPGRARRSWASSPSTSPWRPGRKCFYTTPIKALSNQKYHDLVARYGPDQVGLLTGDNTVNGEAPVVVMTTEVLRNMLYAGSRTLLGLGFVVMDEVHYLADRSRGAVWEEVIIHLPESVTLVSLSATVSNAEEFGEWLATVRGETTTIVEERRPVPLYQHVMVGRRLLDLFAELRRRRRRRLRQGGRAGQRRADEGGPRRLGRHPADARPPLAARAGQGPQGRAPGRQRPPGLDPEPVRRRRPARPRGAAAGDRLHLQPGRLRRGGAAVPGQPASG